jgi:hypothetical protein
VLGKTLRDSGERFGHALDGRGEVGARIAVGYRVHIEIVDLLFPLFERCEPGRKQCPGSSYGE